MARPSKHDGVIYRRNDSNIWWMRYRDKAGRRRLESTQTDDWQEAQRFLRERLQGRDDKTRQGEQQGNQVSTMFNEKMRKVRPCAVQCFMEDGWGSTAPLLPLMAWQHNRHHSRRRGKLSGWG